MRAPFPLTLVAMLFLAVAAGAANAASSFTLFETGQVRPLAHVARRHAPLRGQHAGQPARDLRRRRRRARPTSARCRSASSRSRSRRARNTEVWVVNHLSDSVSIVDVTTPATARVVRTLLVGDEPRDIVFAGPGGNARLHHHRASRPEHAAPADDRDRPHDAGHRPRRRLGLRRDQPRRRARRHAARRSSRSSATRRARSRSRPTAARVYAAVFHSGNRTTTIAEGVVPERRSAPGRSIAAPPGGLPAPNTNFESIAGSRGRPDRQVTTAPLARRARTATGTAAVKFALPDKDVFAIDANANPPVPVAGPSGFYTGVGTILFNMVVEPGERQGLRLQPRVASTACASRARASSPRASSRRASPRRVRGHLAESRITVLDGGVGAAAPPEQAHRLHHLLRADPERRERRQPRVPARHGGLERRRDALRRRLRLERGRRLRHGRSSRTTRSCRSPRDQIAGERRRPDGARARRGALAALRADALRQLDLGPQHRRRGAELAHIALHNPEPASVVAGRRSSTTPRFTLEPRRLGVRELPHLRRLRQPGVGPRRSRRHRGQQPRPVRARPVHQSRLPSDEGPDDDAEPARHGEPRPDALARRPHRRQRRGRARSPTPGTFNEDAAFKKFNPAFAGLLGRSAAADRRPRCRSSPTSSCRSPTRRTRSATSTTRSPPSSRRAATSSSAASPTRLQDCNGCHMLEPTANAESGVAAPGLLRHRRPLDLRGRDPGASRSRTSGTCTRRSACSACSACRFNAGDNGFKGDQVRGFGFLHDGAVDTLFRFHNATRLQPERTSNPSGFPPAPRRSDAPQHGGVHDGVRPQPGADRRPADHAHARQRRDRRPAHHAARCSAPTPASAISSPRAASAARCAAASTSAAATSRPTAAAEPTLTDARAARARAATAGQEVTFTCVPPGSGVRIGDRSRRRRLRRRRRARRRHRSDQCREHAGRCSPRSATPSRPSSSSAPR